MVAAIAVDQLTEQLGLDHYGSIHSEAFPPVAAFTDGRVRDAVRVYAGIALAEGSGAIGGVTGALVADCYRNDVRAAVLIVRSNPYIPDPGAARAVIENALEPLVDFDIDTSELEERAGEIRRQMDRIAQQLQEYHTPGHETLNMIVP